MAISAVSREAFVGGPDAVCIASVSVVSGVSGAEPAELGDDGKNEGSVGSVSPIGERAGVDDSRKAGEVGVLRRT